MAITFPVDDVAPNLNRLPVDPSLLAQRIGGEPVVYSEGADRLIAGKGPGLPGRELDVHPLAGAVHLAFAQHRPLLLTPDALWLTIAQGFAIHVNHHHESLRERFVRHEGQKMLQVAAASLAARGDWERSIDEFATLLGEEVGQGLVRLMTCTFSTTTPAALTASQVVLMDTFKRYFDYEIACVCGIPRITLAGTAEDYADIRRRALVLAEYDLGWWIDALLPVIDQWIATAEGRIDTEFWKSIYKPADAYGGEVATGWIVRLFPYLGSDNPIQNRLRPLHARDAEQEPTSQRPWLHMGLSPSDFPRGLSEVPVRVTGLEESIYVLLAGLLGLAQREDGAIEPLPGWAVRLEPMETLWERLRTRHETSPAGEQHKVRFYPQELTKVLLSFYSSFHTASLHGGAVAIRAHDQIQRRTLERNIRSLRFADCADGSYLLLVRIPSDGSRFVLHARGPFQDPHDLPVIARSILEFFQRVAEGDEPYFLAPAYQSHGLLKTFLNARS